jgi:hypothetical protein
VHVAIELKRTSPVFAGSTRQSMLRFDLSPISMNARVKPAHDEVRVFQPDQNLPLASSARS